MTLPSDTLLARYRLLDRSELTHSVVLGIIANTAAVHLLRSVELVIAAERRRRHKEGIKSRFEHAIIRHSITIICAFLSYYLVYAFTGFVPMGFVTGAKPLIPYFDPH